MKKFFLLCAFALISTGAMAQKNVIKINPLGLIFHYAQVGYERALNERMTVGGFADYFFYNLDAGGSVLSTSNYSSSFKFSGFGITPEFRFYPLAKWDAPRGFFVGPFLDFNRYMFDYTEKGDFGIDSQGNSHTNYTATGSASAMTFGGGLIVGWQFIIADHLSIDLLVGGGYAGGSFGNYTVSYSDNNTSVSQAYGGSYKVGGSTIRAGLNLGYAF